MTLTSSDQLVAHGVGDYILQSDWMANRKSQSNVAALLHALTYTIPFLFLRPSRRALAFIAGSHFLIDRFRLARYLCWAKNQTGPIETRELTPTGYPASRPAWLATWLLIISDNLLHIMLNGWAIRKWQ